MASAALWPSSAENILYFAFVALCGALQTHFHRKGRKGKQAALPTTPLFPQETGVADAVLIYDPSGENGFQESPQTFLKPEN